MGEMPFYLVYGLEVVDLVEIAVPMHRLRHFSRETNDDKRRLELDMAYETRWASEEVQGRMRITMTRYYNCRVLARQFFVGKMVLRRTEFTY